MLQHIIQPVREELEAFDRLYKGAFSSPIPDFRFMFDFILAKNGKRIRPLILILAAKLCGKVTPETLRYAVVVELLHTATLIHDDVVDNTRERRGQLSVMARFDNRIAVLLGDYILSQAIRYSVEMGNMRILKIMATLSQNLAEGELTQLIALSGAIIDEKHYFDVIWKKTAILLASCSEIGAVSSGASADKTDKLRSIGANLGICFQLRDDIFDYFEQGDLGKPTGNDIREGKITLPLLHALQIASPAQSTPIMAIIQKQDFSPTNIRLLIDFAKEHQGIEYTYAKMQEFKTATFELLSTFPDSEAKTAMKRMMNYIIERKD